MNVSTVLEIIWCLTAYIQALIKSIFMQRLAPLITTIINHYQRHRKDTSVPSWTYGDGDYNVQATTRSLSNF